jgi:hypothetical protein
VSLIGLVFNVAFMGCRLCLLCFLLVSFVLYSCTESFKIRPKRDREGKNIIAANDSIPLSFPPVTYHYAIIHRKHVDTPTSGLSIILALNRIDLSHLRRIDTLVVPDTLFSDARAYSPFPLTLPILKPVHKLIFYSYRIQAFAAYENGNLVRWGPVSMGKESTPTPTGLFFTNWRSKKTISTVDPDWIMEWYFNLENELGVSMHEYDLPGYPASHACVRLSEEDARWFFDWCDQWVLSNQNGIRAYGTPVIIYGVYHFDRRKPWLALPQNNKATTVTETELIKETEPVMPIILQRQAKRDSITLSL